MFYSNEHVFILAKHSQFSRREQRDIYNQSAAHVAVSLRHGKKMYSANQHLMNLRRDL